MCPHGLKVLFPRIESVFSRIESVFRVVQKNENQVVMSLSNRTKLYKYTNWCSCARKKKLLGGVRGYNGASKTKTAKSYKSVTCAHFINCILLVINGLCTKMPCLFTAMGQGVRGSAGTTETGAACELGRPTNGGCWGRLSGRHEQLVNSGDQWAVGKWGQAADGSKVARS